MDLLQNTAQQWQDHLANGRLTSVDLVNECLDQIEKYNHKDLNLNAIINAAPRDVLHQHAKRLDDERASGHIRGPMHGIPVLLKDIITTGAQHGLPTTCGAFALRAAMGKEDCLLVQRLVAAGMIILAKTNLNEYCRMGDVRSGWSVLGGQTQSPYITGGRRADERPIGNTTISGSSSGSAAGVAAGFAPVSIGTETIGSLVMPASRGGLYALKVTATRAPQGGILCLSRDLDSLGAMAKSAADVQCMTEIIMGVQMGVETPERGEEMWKTTRVGFVDAAKWRWEDDYCFLEDGTRRLLDERYDQTIEALAASGLGHVARVEVSDEPINFDGQNIVRLAVDHDFKTNFSDFLAGLQGQDNEIGSLADLIDYNASHADEALPEPFSTQSDTQRVRDVEPSPSHMQEALAYGKRLARERLGKAMGDDRDENKLDILVGPSDSPLFIFAALAGYPIATVPWMMVPFGSGDNHGKDGESDTDGVTQSRPEGLSFVGREGSEKILLDFMAQYEKRKMAPEAPHLPAQMMG